MLQHRNTERIILPIKVYFIAIVNTGVLHVWEQIFESVGSVFAGPVFANTYSSAPEICKRLYTLSSWVLRSGTWTEGTKYLRSWNFDNEVLILSKLASLTNNKLN